MAKEKPNTKTSNKNRGQVLCELPAPCFIRFLGQSARVVIPDKG